MAHTPTLKHTPLPWFVGDLDGNGQRMVRQDHIEICTCWHHSVGSIEREMEANAAFIVLAVNSHDALVEALREAEQTLDGLLLGRSIHNSRKPDQRIEGPLWGRASEAVKIARAALALATPVTEPVEG